MLFRSGTITLTTARGKATAFGTLPTRRSFKVAGVFDVGMHEYDTSFIFMPLDVAGDFLGLLASVSGLEIYVDDPQNIAFYRTAITGTLEKNLRAFDWLDRNKSFLNALAVERNVMFLILTLIILVAAFNIVSSMIMLVRSKNADIAVLRTMGASSGSILRIFLMTGASIGVVGTAIGSVLGMLFCWKIDAIKEFLDPSLIGFNN